MIFKYKKYNLILILFFSVFLTIEAQTYKDMMLEGTNKVSEIQQAAYNYFSNIGTGRGTGYKQFKRWEYNALRDQNEQGYLKSPLEKFNEYIRYKNYAKSKNVAVVNKSATVWEELGPSYYNDTSGWNPGVGRLTSVAIDDTNPNIMIVGAHGGGVWKTTDGGNNWVVLTDDMPGLPVFSLTIDPSNNSIYYWGASRSIFKSTDAGTTWNLLSSGINGTVTEILVNPTNSNIMYCATTSTIYRSVDAGISWSAINANTTVSKGYDIQYKPGDLNTIYASGTGFYKSTDGGVSFTEITGFSTGAKMIGVTANDPSVVYVLEANGHVFGGLYKSTDSGSTFTQLDHTGKNYFGYQSDASDDSGQAPRDMDIVVNPSNVNEVHIAGILTWLSTDGGVSFSVTSQWVPSTANSENIGYCHADVDILIYKNSKLYAGTDGGIFVANNPTSVNSSYYTDLTTGIGVRQFYKIGVSQTNPEIVTGGSQDNGTSVYTNTGVWKDWLGADGMETFVDKDNSNYLYGTSQYGTLYVSLDGGNSRSGLSTPEGKSGNWITPFEQDPLTANTLYTGYDKVYKGTFTLFFGIFPSVNWTAISQDFGTNIDHLKIAPSNNNIMYAAHGSNLYKTIDGGATNWTAVTGFSGSINSIAIHPTNPNKIAIATTGAQKVYISYNGGLSWSSQLYDLPNFSALSLVWDNHINGDVLYLGMNYGVYYLLDADSTWNSYNTDLPNVKIGELDINFVTDVIYAGTYGRGLWKADLIVPPASASHDFMANAILFNSSEFSSTNAQYTTSIGTSDGLNTSCAGIPKNNVWFKFVATNTDQSLFILTGGAYGTLKKPIMSVWNEAGTTEIACYQDTSADRAYINMDNLTVGNTYLVSIDNTNSSDVGSFTLFGDDSELQSVDSTLGTDEAGLIRYNDGINKFQGWNGTNWVNFN